MSRNEPELKVGDIVEVIAESRSELDVAYDKLHDIEIGIVGIIVGGNGGNSDFSFYEVKLSPLSEPVLMSPYQLKKVGEVEDVG